MVERSKKSKKMLSHAKILLFPEDKVVRRIGNDLQPETPKEKVKTFEEEVDAYVTDFNALIQKQFEKDAPNIDLDKIDFQRDLSAIKELVRSTIYRNYGLYHRLQDEVSDILDDKPRVTFTADFEPANDNEKDPA